MQRLAPLALCLALIACDSRGAASPAAGDGPVETRSPNAAGQSPAYPWQTRAPQRRAGVAFAIATVAEGLDHPWGLAFLPDGRMLVTERPGRLRVVDKDGALSAPVAGAPAVDGGGQGGLLDVALDPAFATNGLVYLSYSEPRSGGNGTAVARGRLEPGPAPRLTDVRVIWRQTPTLNSSLHFGGRLVFARDGTLFVTTGERSIQEGRVQAQRLDGTLGKVVRINSDGSIPSDNPFVREAGAKPEIWSLGHRNIQAAALNPATGQLWTVEHGARGGDEVNAPKAGHNYGWPVITYGEEYWGQPIGAGITRKGGMDQPIYYWDPVIAPSGMAFYDADLFPAWKGSLFVGALAGEHLDRLTLQGERVVGEERLLTDLGERIRDVRVGPDGAVYVLTDNSRGRVLKLVPRR